MIYLRVDPKVSQRLLIERYKGQEKRDIHEKDKEYLSRCQEAADYCSHKLGWKTIECCDNGEMRSIEDIRCDIERIIYSLL